MNIAQNIALWLSLINDDAGEGSTVAFPGSSKAYRGTWSDCSQDMIHSFLKV